MANETRFLYSINPKKVIKFLCGKMMCPPIRTSKSLSLTKDEVRECLLYGSVYRRFANENKIERVTTLNIDRLHNEKFLTEEEYYKMMTTKESDDNRGTVINEELHVEDKKEVVEQVKEAHQEVEDTVEEEITESEKEEVVIVESEEDSMEEVEEEYVDDTNEPAQSPDEEDVESEIEESTKEKQETSNSKQQYYYNKNYGGKNKHKH